MDTNTVTITSPSPNNGTLSGGLKFSNGNIVPIGPSGAVPEPASFVLLGLGSGLVGLLLAFRKRLLTGV